MRPSVAILLTACLAACQAPQDGSPGGPTPLVPEGQPTPDRRVILYDARSQVTMILVNQGNSRRKQETGRARLALNRRGQGYKVLSEKEMEALLISFNGRKFESLATPFRRGDEDYLLPRAQGPSFLGILYVEEGSRRRKLLSFRPHGPNDLDGQARLLSFRDLKAMVFRAYNFHFQTETPQLGAAIPPARR